MYVYQYVVWLKVCHTCPTVFRLLFVLLSQNRVAQENITIYVGAGTYKPTNGSALAVINSWNIALIGSGRDRTHFECGAYGDNDSPCSYMNFQIRTSSNVYVRGFTFTRCGPITSAVYIATSNNIIFEDCEFR